MMNAGAAVIDVRTPMEFDGGHYNGSINIPLDQLPYELDRIKGMQKPIVVVCRSGARSGRAAGFLSQNGLEVENGGPWTAL